MIQSFHLCLLRSGLGFGFLHGFGVEILTDGQILGIAIYGFPSCVGEAIIGGVRAYHMRFLLKLVLAVVGCPLPLQDLPGDVVDCWFEG